MDVLGDLDAMDRAFEAKAEPLITYPGALGDFFGDQLGRDEFVAFTGATGRGKTWWLMDIAWRAMLQGRRVAFFEVGDMSEAQMLRRLATRVARHPTKLPPGSKGWPLDVQVPTNIEPGDGEVAEVEFKTKTYKGPLTPGLAKAALKKLWRRLPKDSLKLSTHAACSINVGGIRGILDGWERRSGWAPDVVVIDYADILGPPAGIQPGDREAHNVNWMGMRGLSQDRHCLVATATQGDANSYDADVISRSNFSDDRRKNDHVTGMVGINGTDAEKQLGVQRLNWTKRREDAYLENACVHVAGCLTLGNPAIKSF